jgi:hypothetical protein
MTLHLLCQETFLPLWSSLTIDLEVGMKIRLKCLHLNILHFCNVGCGAKISLLLVWSP